MHLTSDRADDAIPQDVEAHDLDRKVALGQPFADDQIGLLQGTDNAKSTTQFTPAEGR